MGGIIYTNTHICTHNTAELKKKILLSDRLTCFIKTFRQICTDPHFQKLSASVEWIPCTLAPLIVCTMQSYQPKPTSFSFIWPSRSCAVSPQYLPHISKAPIHKSTTIYRLQPVFQVPSTQLLHLHTSSTQPEYVISMHVSVILDFATVCLETSSLQRV